MLKRVFSTLSPLSSSSLTISLTLKPKPKLPNDKLIFGKTFTDHMLEIDWDKKNGWSKPSIHPHRSLSIDPAASCLHYGLQAFEGMKAYLDKDNKIRLFRPDMNMKRLQRSGDRLNFPNFDSKEFLECIKSLIKVDKSWIPKDDGYALYIRPTFIATHPFLGVQPPSNVKMFAILSPVGPYYPEGFNPVRLYADNKYVRAWPGGTGDSKIGPNYAGTIKPQGLAAEKGYSQILWLFNDNVTEVGTMNLFFFWKTKEGKRELVTAPLDGTILPGVTRDSILTLCRHYGEFDVTERTITIHEVIDAVKSGRLLECFGSGTAAIVSPVNGFHFFGTDYVVPLDPSNPSAKSGLLTQRLWNEIVSIQYGRKNFRDWSVVID